MSKNIPSSSQSLTLSTTPSPEWVHMSHHSTSQLPDCLRKYYAMGNMTEDKLVLLWCVFSSSASSTFHLLPASLPSPLAVKCQRSYLQGFISSSDTSFNGNVLLWDRICNLFLGRFLLEPLNKCHSLDSILSILLTPHWKNIVAVRRFTTFHKTQKGHRQVSLSE